MRRGPKKLHSTEKSTNLITTNFPRTTVWETLL